MMQLGEELDGTEVKYVGRGFVPWLSVGMYESDFNSDPLSASNLTHLNFN